MDDLRKKVCIAIVNIFESGSVKGNYGAVTILKGDSGHLTYGRSQTTLGSGNLYSLIKAYCNTPDGQHGSELSAYLTRIAAKDFTLDTDAAFKAILREAGTDPAMQREQDAFFDRNYYTPSVDAANRAGLHQPLSQAVVYDSHIQGGWGRLAKQVIQAIGAVSPQLSEERWIEKYIDTRTAYLTSCKPPLPSTCYRMQAFSTLIKGTNWGLTLPLVVHGVSITDASFATEPALPVVRASVPDPVMDSRPILRPVLPYTKGAEVLELQKMLNTAGMTNSLDQIYGPFTQALVGQFQKRNGLQPDAVVGPRTWSLLMAASAVAA